MVVRMWGVNMQNVNMSLVMNSMQEKALFVLRFTHLTPSRFFQETFRKPFLGNFL